MFDPANLRVWCRTIAGSSVNCNAEFVSVAVSSARGNDLRQSAIEARLP